MRGGEGVAERAPAPHADGGGLVEMQRVDGGRPSAFLGTHQDARVGHFVGLRERTPPRHVGLADEQEKLKFFLGRKRGIGSPAEGGEQTESEGGETNEKGGEAHGGVRRVGWPTLFLSSAVCECEMGARERLKRFHGAGSCALHPGP